MAEYTVEDYKNAARKARKDNRDDLVQYFVGQAKALEAQELSDAYGRGVGGELAYAGGAGGIRGATDTVDLMSKAPDAVFGLLERGGARMAEAIGLKGATEAMDRVQTGRKKELAEAPTLRQRAADLTGGYSEYQSPLDIGKYGGTIGEFGGGALALPIGGFVKSAASSILPAIASETAGQAFEGTEYEGPARIAAALGAPTAVAAGTPMLRRSVIGPKADVQGYLKGSTRPESVKTLRGAGIDDISAGQEIGSVPLMKLEGAEGPSLRSQAQLTRAAAREAGIDMADDVLQARTISQNRDRLGAQFDVADDLSGGVPTQAEGFRAVDLVTEAEGLMSEGVKVPKALLDSAESVGNAAIDGVPLKPETIKQLRAKLNKAIKTYAPAMDKNIEYSLAVDLLENLDDMVTRQASSIDPNFASSLAKTRQQYRAHLTIERALTGAGQNKAAGLLTPESLAGAVRRREGVSYVRGTGTDLGELARAGQEVLSPLPTTAAGGNRTNVDRLGRAGQIRDVVPAMGARFMQDTLRKPTSQAVLEQLAKRGLRQTGGLLNVQ